MSQENENINWASLAGLIAVAAIAAHREEISKKGTNSEKSYAQTSRTIDFIIVSVNKVDLEFTPNFLSSKLSPYLLAIDVLQKTISELLNFKPSKIKIKKITQNSPISLSLEGASEAVQTIQEVVIPWKRNHAELMSHLYEQEKIAEIEIKKAEILEKRANASKSRAEAEKVLEEVRQNREATEKLKLENQKTRLEIQKEKIKFALEIIDKLTEELDETKRINYVHKLLEPLDIITLSDIEISVTNKNAG